MDRHTEARTVPRGQPHTVEAMMRSVGSGMDTGAPSKFMSFQVMAATRAQCFWSEKCTLGVSWRSLCKALPELLLCVLGQSSRHWSCCWSDALPQYIIVGLLLFLYASEKTGLWPHVCAPRKWRRSCGPWLGFRYSLLSPAATRTQIIQACGTTTYTAVLPLILLWPCWDFHFHQSWFRASLWQLTVPLILKNVY